MPHEEWWRAILDGGREGIDGFFVHPVADEAVMAGNGTIGLELDEDAPEFDSVVIPWGGGGLTSGIASALKALRPEVRVVTAEPETGAPLAASLGHASPRDRVHALVGRRRRRPLAHPRRCGSARASSSTRRSRCSLEETAEAVRLLATRAHVVAEGAGALALAAALKRDDRCVCIVSGGNIDALVLVVILGATLA